MEFLLLAVETEAAFAERDDPDRAPAYWAGWQGYVTALEEAGVLRGANGLHPPATATTVRVVEGRVDVQDGPYADTKEQLGGYFVVDVPDLDAALGWAGRCPSAAAGGSCEVRPVLPPPRPAGA
ncbi:YciI family protein [Aquipuribacter nitratireducens]|uniref:YciI family protein n=1 Tax=Aquipuribacter nitratireducens TaxID=650104 RepID=A0ABW0GLT1_9MICO